MRRAVRIVLCLSPLVFAFGCTIGEVKPGIKPEETTWIQKGKTTRQEIVARFGEPDFVGTGEGVGQYAEYSLAGEAPLDIEARPEGPFPQTFEPPARSMPEARSLTNRLWIVYDTQGVVEDFGIGVSPVRRSQSNPRS